MSREEQLAERLQSVAEDLDELIFERLRDRDTSADKRLTQARRAIEKAAHLLRAADAPGEFD